MDGNEAAEAAMDAAAVRAAAAIIEGPVGKHLLDDMRSGRLKAHADNPDAKQEYTDDLTRRLLSDPKVLDSMLDIVLSRLGNGAGAPRRKP